MLAADENRFSCVRVACTCLAVLAVLAIGAPVASADTAVHVSGGANPWLAGRDSVPPETDGEFPPSIPVTAGSALVFPTATGTFSCCGGGSENGPDGQNWFFGPCCEIQPLRGISGLVDRTTPGPNAWYLVGVFLGGGPPSGAAPPSLDFTNRHDFSSLSPRLGQAFFVGDGRTTAGALQSFNPPAGATRLFLGVSDFPCATCVSGTYYDNVGAFDVTVRPKASRPPVLVAADVRPDQCPNQLKLDSAEDLAVAVAGTRSFDAARVDPASVRLEGIAPLRWQRADVTRPFRPFTGRTRPEQCTKAGPDGLRDLKLKFSIRRLAAALAGHGDGDVVVLHLTGKLKDGRRIEGEDVVITRVRPSLTRGLISHWKAEGNALDSADGNHGTLRRGTTFAGGRIGAQAFALDGVDDDVAVPQAPNLDPGGQVTMSFWMNSDPSNGLDECCQGLVTTDFYVVEVSSSTGPVGVNFAVSTNSGASFVHTSDVNPGSAQVSRGAWHHVAGVYDGTELVLYIDGKPFGKPTPHTGPISPMLPGSYLAFGSEDGRNTCGFCQQTRYFHGKIDDVRIYDRALSRTEVGKLAAAP